uniref:Uncharacterized protein n=1 Tax=Physcomitrium patens TaxID=3218 RepID=A0A2K1K5N1_PHYPA|nr:hypothetical protein PHYPA_010981 [Physcomitrium patens]
MVDCSSESCSSSPPSPVSLTLDDDDDQGPLNLVNRQITILWVVARLHWVQPRTNIFYVDTSYRKLQIKLIR